MLCFGAVDPTRDASTPWPFGIFLPIDSKSDTSNKEMEAEFAIAETASAFSGAVTAAPTMDFKEEEQNVSILKKKKETKLKYLASPLEDDGTKPKTILLIL